MLWSLNTLEEMIHALEDLATHQEVRVAVLRGNGPMFSAGHDLHELADGDLKAYRKIFATCMKMMLLLSEIPQPVIAAVHGIATAAGCQLVAACDLAIAAEDARFRHPRRQDRLFLYHADGAFESSSGPQESPGDAVHR